LKIVKTAGARSRIKRWLKARDLRDGVDSGVEMLQREFRKAKRPFPGDEDLEDVARTFGKADYEDLMFAVGCGDVSCQQIFRKFYPAKEPPQPPKPARAPARARPSLGVRVQGMDGIMIRFAKCCQPVPGDHVVGVVTKGRGISVHRDLCQNVFRQGIPRERVIEADWDTAKDQTFPVRVSLVGEDRRNLLADVAQTISDQQANIIRSDMASHGPLCSGVFILEVRNVQHLSLVLKALSRVKGVREVSRKGESGAE
jgi:GTP pyrophosphokinase